MSIKPANYINQKNINMKHVHRNSNILHKYVITLSIKLPPLPSDACATGDVSNKDAMAAPVP